MKTYASNLEKALRQFISGGINLELLASILEFASLKGTVSYEEARIVIGEEPEEPLLDACDWRLLLPVRTMKSMAWEDRIFLPANKELFAMPNIITMLVKNALISSQWQAEEAIGGIFRQMGDPHWHTIPDMVEAMAAAISEGTISGSQIKRICFDFGFSNKADWLIAELKEAGIISPKLSSPADVMKAGSPLYEMNPSIAKSQRPS